jgi:two-component system, chemotaxis family, chemotaxis protein CheY
MTSWVPFVRGKVLNHEIKTGLLVDDSKLSRKIQRRVLSEIGVTSILEAKDGQDALNTLKEVNYQVDVILTDWNMPVLDGLGFIKKLREKAEGKEIPIIVVSSEGEREKIIHALKMGANSYVTKPFRKEVLARKVKNVENVTSLSRRASSNSSISGNLGMFGFAELVHFLNFAGKSGVLKVYTGSEKAGVGFNQGEIQSSWHGELHSEQAFFTIARAKQGDFEFLENEEIPEKTIHGSTMSLLMEAMRVIDEEENSV